MADITATRINNLHEKIKLVLGVGAGQNGYGQVLVSSPVSNLGDIASAEDVNNIYADVLKARIHQVGVGDIGIAEVIQNLNTIALDTSNFVDDDGITTPDPEGNKKGIVDFENLMSSVEIDKFLMHPSQAALEPAINSVRTATWNGLIKHQVIVTFTDENERRYFFNTGGEIRISANNTSASTPKGLDWAEVCSQVGIVSFSANNTQSTQGGAQSIGNYTLTSSDQTVYQKIGGGTYSAVYAGNIYTIKARSESDNTIIFTVEFNDVVFDNNVDNNVDGRLESTFQHYRASADVDVAAPAYFNQITLA